MHEQNAVEALGALAQVTRLRIFRCLVRAGSEGLVVSDIAGALDIPAATLSFHLKNLAQAGLVVTRNEGRFVRCTAHFEGMNALLGYLTENCCGGAACEIQNIVFSSARGCSTTGNQ